MRFRFADLWMWNGVVGRGPYLLVGLLGFAVKHNLDRVTVAAIRGEWQWTPFSYWVPPLRWMRLAELDSPKDLQLCMALIGVALPFVWIGINMTLKRLRSIGWPLWLVCCFFVPFLNLLFFLLLAVIPAAPMSSTSTQGPAPVVPPRWLDGVIPRTMWGSAFLAVGCTVLLGIVCVFLGTAFAKTYGWGLFIGIPFTIGFGAALIYGYHMPRSLMGCLGVAVTAVTLVGGLLFAFAVEGLICLAMAAPLAIILALMGGLVGYAVQRGARCVSGTPAALAVLVVGLPGLIGVEGAIVSEPPLLAVRTSVDIAAPPEQVWEHVVAFAEIPPPTEWLFRHGIAYPIRAEIDGRGVGVKRRCVFSTGAFVEPIEVWDAPRLLRFGVEAHPPPMVEWSPYAQIAPAHLDGYWQSRRGQFLLTPLANGGTHLEGTTWYTNAMWPVAYWQLWSDAMVHRIHRRVLRHIKAEVEGSAG